jgi:putative ubiquitin-RnfH superfamily antitoxin RatB of RatAB toxin-antitoxin module
MANAQLCVEVAYATPTRQWLKQLVVPAGCTVAEAIALSGLMRDCSELRLEQPLSVGIFSKPCQLETVLQDAQRVEIYRPLTCDPKQARRQRGSIHHKRGSKN